MLRAHARLFEQLTLLTDVVLIATCWITAYIVRFYVVGPPLVGPQPPPFRGYLLQLVPIIIVWAVAFRALGLYRPHRLGSRLSELVDIAKASTLGVLLLIGVMTFVFHGSEYSRVVIVYFWLLSIIALAASRTIFREALRVARRRGLNLRHAVIVGGGIPAARIAAALHRRPDAGVKILGVLGNDDTPQGLVHLGDITDLRRLLDDGRVDIVVIALPQAQVHRIREVLASIGDDPVAIHLVPDLGRLAAFRGAIEQFDGLPVIQLREAPSDVCR